MRIEDLMPGDVIITKSTFTPYIIYNKMYPNPNFCYCITRNNERQEFTLNEIKECFYLPSYLLSSYFVYLSTWDDLLHSERKSFGSQTSRTPTKKYKKEFFIRNNIKMD